jgi:beta-glucosidase
MAGADVGVVVVGETPYAEGFGDIAGPECGFCAPALQEEKSLSLQPQDRAVIAKVCGAITTCVVLIVSGRPQVVTDQLGQMDALVASWLPGSEGAGVADVLFGRRPFTGRLPMSWPASAAQVPVNVGDPTYQPLFPYGWGLRTGHGGDDLITVARDAAQQAVIAGRAPANWRSLLADAEHALMSGHRLTAWLLLIRATRP